ncbi:protein asteroid-like isoform X2 [Linepithema humile]|uniref:protein asteroid-like isoform X2 n=1 Tax=Linepithema humile TaxID=83485 RepID=UPI00351E9B19
MGIFGLTTFISNQSEHYFTNYALHDTYLVIDGNSIAHCLYTYAKCNSAFGVLIDGGCEDKKLETDIYRTKQKIQKVSRYTHYFKQVNQFFPLLMKVVFKDVMTEKGIKYAQCIFEADNIIAAIARILDCPVLSYDSDFYIYGSLYIPFNTWEKGIVRKSTGRGYMKCCKIYDVEKLFQAYDGLNQTLLPLAAILIGNDYVKKWTFKNFFHQLELSQATGKMYDEQQWRIDATFNWLKKLNLNQAVTEILSRLRREKRKHVLNIIETMINGYINASLDVLHVLGVPVHKISKAKLQNVFKAYKFEGDIYNLTYIDESTSETKSSDDDDEIDDKEITSICAGKEVVSNESLVNNLPQWFINEFKLGRYPSYFINIIIRKLYVCRTQIEDHLYSSSIFASLNIISVIYGLLMSGIEEEKTCMEYITRDGITIKRFQLEYNNSVLDYKLPLLSNLGKLPMIIRKEILNNTLRITDESCISEIPPNWKLYVATMKYWIDQKQQSFKEHMYILHCFIYSLLFAMLFNVIDRKIGVHRVLREFNHRFDKLVEKIQNTRKVENYQPEYLDNTTLVSALHKVDRHDCWIAASFFVSNFETNPYLHPKDFKIIIVHGFAEFQNCLSHSMALNALLGYPYEQTKVASVFSGTLLYNLCNNFKKCDNIEEYINTVLQNSPSLLRLFNVLLLKVKPLVGMA